MNLPLYELAAEYRQQLAVLNELDLDDVTFVDTLESISGDIETKAVNVAKFIKTLDATAEAIKQAESDMATRRKAVESKAQRIRDYLLDNMQACAIQKIESPWFKIAIRQNPASVIIDRVNGLPSSLMTFHEAPPPTPNKKAIKAELEAGNYVDGAHLEHGVRLEIK